MGRNRIMTILCIGEKSFETFRTLAMNGPCQCLNDDRLERLFRAILSTRKTRKVSFNIMRDTLDKLSTYGPLVIVAAVDAYLEKQEPPRGYSEKYLLGIARGEAKRAEGALLGTPRKDEPEKAPGPSSGEVYLSAVIGRLRELYPTYATDSLEAKAIVTAGQGLHDLADKLKLQQIMAGELDAKATLIEFSFREAVPGVGIPRFSPYGMT